MKSYRCHDWSVLAGLEVEIRANGQVVRTGVVEIVMPDAAMLWLSSDHNGNRTLFEAAEGYEVWTNPDDLPDALYWTMICQKPSDGAKARDKSEPMNTAEPGKGGSLK